MTGGPVWSLLSLGASGASAASHRPHDEEQDHRSDEGDHDAAEQTDGGVDEESDQKATDHRADQADDEITDQAVSTALHHAAGQEAGHQDHDGPDQPATRTEREVIDVHLIPPFVQLKSRRDLVTLRLKTSLAIRVSSQATSA